MAEKEKKWSKNANIYPNDEEIAFALQDTGKTVDKKQKGNVVTKTRYPLLEKLAGKSTH